MESRSKYSYEFKCDISLTLDFPPTCEINSNMEDMFMKFTAETSNIMVETKEFMAETETYMTNFEIRFQEQEASSKINFISNEAQESFSNNNEINPKECIDVNERSGRK